MRYTQEEFVPRLTRYRQLSTAEETLPDYFDEQEIHPQHIGILALKDTYFLLFHQENNDLKCKQMLFFSLKMQLKGNFSVFL